MNTFDDEISQYHKVTPEKISGFFKAYRFLSNFHSCGVYYNECHYTSSEAAFQAAKSLDPKVHKAFTQLTAATSKKEGRNIKLREDWEEVKDQIMLDIIFSKFNNDELADLLINTGDAVLEETNHWGDTYWGVDSETGEGKNKLGKILMIVRAVIKDRKTSKQSR